jgi:RND family efflux transporter MFP subunit
LARVTLDRNKPLIAQGAISQQEFDIFTARYASSQAETMAAQAALDSATLDLSFTEIRAPFKGRMSATNIDPGNLVVPNTTVMANLVSQQPIYVYFNIDEGALLRYRKMRVELSEEESLKPLRDLQIPVLLALGNEKEFSIEGVIDYSDPEVDPATGTIRVRALFANEDGRLVPGLFGRVRVTVAAARDAIQLPLRAIGTDQNNKFVYVIDKDGTAQYRQVRLGRESEALAVVEEGLTAEDKVVIDGLLKIRPGSKPEVREADLSSFRTPATVEPVASTGGEAEVATP